MNEGFRDGELGSGLSDRKILRDPQLASLAFEVRDQIREQFSAQASDDAPGEGSRPEELEAYRTKLEFWANLFETLLNETKSELSRLSPDR